MGTPTASKLHPAARSAFQHFEDTGEREAQRFTQEAEAASVAKVERRRAREQAANEEQAWNLSRQKKQAHAQSKIEESRLRAQAQAEAERRMQHDELKETRCLKGLGKGEVHKSTEGHLDQQAATQGQRKEEWEPETPLAVAHWDNADGESSTSFGSSCKVDGDFLSCRATLVCVMGHVDAGKTSMLDKLRSTNVQGKEFRGMTQQIGATFFPPSSIIEQASKVNDHFELALPGMLVIDTPGHETFHNLRLRGASLCDIAVVVVNIKKGLEPQTIESLNLLQEHHCPFVVALNQVDRLYGWEGSGFESMREALKRQQQVAEEFDQLLRARMLELNELGFNCGLHWEINKTDRSSTVPLVPTSARTGQGVSDLIYLLASLSQELLAESLEQKDELECVVLEVRAGDRSDVGVTADVLLKHGSLREGDRIVLAGSAGPVVTTIKSLLTPQPMADARARPKYTSHRSVSGSMSVKIVATGLETAMAGSRLHVAESKDALEKLRREVQAELQGIMVGFQKQDSGVFVKASELGKLEALMSMLHAKGIPVLDVGVGEVQLKDVKRAAVMREKRMPEYAVIFAFDAQVASAAQNLAKREKVRIVTSKSIYELEAALDAFAEARPQTKQQAASRDVVFPVLLRTLCSFQTSPMALGCVVEAGQLRLGTPLCIQREGGVLAVGHVASIQMDGKSVEVVRKGDQAEVKFAQTGEQEGVKYGRGELLGRNSLLCSLITHRSVDALKRHFSREMLAEDWQLLDTLKRLYSIS